MSVNVTKSEEIPDAAYYVLAIDRFMSGWGESSGKDNVIILPCDTANEAYAVQRALEERSEMVSISARPYGFMENSLNLDRYYYSLFDPKNASAWYRADVKISNDESGVYYFEIDFPDNIKTLGSAPDFWSCFNSTMLHIHNAGWRHCQVKWELNIVPPAPEEIKQND